ncbi:MAG TPA: PrsW family glutamic-type intramembrane protease [Ktedonobacteraceae bacterium]|nr:PrsW family glutamic-type intramembrane protease [Ktedonobacteraceae bacterium]
MNQNYGVLRVVRVKSGRPTASGTQTQGRYATGWLPEDGLVHVLSRQETSIGRALNNDVILMDPTVSREHARLLLDAHGWHVINLTAHNIVRVNGHAVPSGGAMPVQPQDLLILGSTMLQLIAPNSLEAAKTAIVPDMRIDASASNGNTPLARVQENSLVNGRPPTPARYQPIALPEQPEPEQEAQPWDGEEEVSVLGAGVTMQFALPQRMGIRTRWLIAGIGIALLLISAMITIILNSIVGISALSQNGVSSIIAALTIPLVPAIGIFLLVNFMDRYEREPWFLRLAAFLWGAVIAIPPALFIEQNIDNLLQNVFDPNNSNEIIRVIFQGLNAGITEETFKGIGLLLLFIILRDEFDNVTDGIVYGALIGAGFAMVENFSYFAQHSKDSLAFLIVGRIILGWLGHSTFIACFGAALGYIRHTRVRWKQIVIPIIGFLIAVGLHSFFDFVTFQVSASIHTSVGNSAVVNFAQIAIVGNYIPPFLAQVGLLYILIKSLSHEAAVVREFLAVEVSNGVVTVGEYALLQNSFQRTRAERRVLRKFGVKQWLRVKALYQTEIGLAFRKWHVNMGDKPKLGYVQPEDAYRQRIKRLRHEIRMHEVKTMSVNG